MKEKECKLCKITSSLSNFPLHKKSKDGVENRCKPCKKIYDSKRYKEDPEYHIKKATEWGVNNPQRKLEIMVKYQNSDKYRKSWDEYYKNNQDKLKKVAREWNSTNKDRINVRDKNKYNNDIQFKIRKILRSRLTIALNGNFKSQSTLTLLGQSIDEFKLYLESLFFPEMNWENHGETWEIDHILPCVSFDLTHPEQQKQCFHYTNLQPLFKTTEIAESFGYTDHIGNRNKGKNI